MPWYKANFHCHSTNSDGHSSPLEVAEYYKAIGMDVVTVSDHNSLTALAEYAEALTGACIGIPCSEYTGAKCAHVLAVDVETAVGPARDQSDLGVVDILQDGVNRTLAAGGVPVLCHPGWYWTYDQVEILAVTRASHFEVFNSSPDCNSYPLVGRSAMEGIWDHVLSAGRRLFGTANDDAHWHTSPQSVGAGPNRFALGGTGWNVIKAPELTRAAIRSAFAAGHFYASTGVELSRYRVSADRIALSVRQASQEHMITEFYGEGGRLLDRQEGPEASYAIAGDEGYVRARVIDTNRWMAFTQPVFLETIEQDIAWTRE
ncbi:MAG: hypothetical protein E4H09_00025 [Spirochaetales bacterium]|nr:MAG: hypothetical protein E4H09_00025 [Spirochaetales bacterium]